MEEELDALTDPELAAVMVMLLVTASVVLIRGGGVYIMGQYHQPLWMIWIILASDLFVRGILVYGRFLQGGWKKIRV